MNWIRNTIVAVAALGIGAVGGFFGTPMVKSEPVVVYSSPGGAIFEFIGYYNKVANEKSKLEIRGVCASACTFFLGLVPKERVCYDDKAYLGFHGVYSGGFFSPPVFNKVMTEWTYDYVYTPEVIKKLNELGWSIEHDVDQEAHPTGLIWTKGEFLKDLGYQKCAD